MRHFTLAGLLLALIAHSLPGQATNPRAKAEPKSRSDQELIQSAWQIVGLEANGKPEPSRNYLGNVFIFARDKASLWERGFVPIDFAFTLDPGKTPKAIDLTAKNVALRGIYKLEGDDLTLCLGIGGGRPTEFATRSGGDTETFKLKRSKWEKYTDKAFGFSVDFPGKPEERARTTDTPPGRASTTFFLVTSEPDRLSYVVSVTPLPGKLDAKAAAVAFEAAVKAVVAESDKNARATIESEGKFKAGGISGKELTISLEVPGMKNRSAARARVFVAAERLYVLAVIGAAESVKSPSVGRFWGSFRLVADRKN